MTSVGPPAAGVLDHREEHVPHVGVQFRALADEEPAGDLHGVGGVVTVGGVLRVVAEEIDRLAAFEVGEAKRRAQRHDAGPVPAGRNDLVDRLPTRTHSLLPA